MKICIKITVFKYFQWGWWYVYAISIATLDLFEHVVCQLEKVEMNKNDKCSILSNYSKRQRKLAKSVTIHTHEQMDSAGDHHIADS